MKSWTRVIIFKIGSTVLVYDVITEKMHLQAQFSEILLRNAMIVTEFSLLSVQWAIENLMIGIILKLCEASEARHSVVDWLSADQDDLSSDLLGD